MTAAEVSRPDGGDLSAEASAASGVVTEALDAKERGLRRTMSELGSVIVAFSGGADSAYLSVIAASALGSRAFAVTAESPSYPSHHRELARRVASDFGLQHEFVRTSELDRPYRANGANRCYYCKQELYTTLTDLARQRGIVAVVDGNNADDRGDFRPGRQAAREHGVRSPLDDAGLTKEEIRTLSNRLGLVTWNEPASACLSSRIPYGNEVTNEKLRMIEDAERVLHTLGFRVYRVRHHESVARLELDRHEMARALDPEINLRLVSGLKALGYRYITLDLQGYRMGSLNESLPLRPI